MTAKRSQCGASFDNEGSSCLLEQRQLRKGKLKCRTWLLTLQSYDAVVTDVVVYEVPSFSVIRKLTPDYRAFGDLVWGCPVIAHLNALIIIDHQPKWYNPRGSKRHRILFQSDCISIPDRVFQNSSIGCRFFDCGYLRLPEQTRRISRL